MPNTPISKAEAWRFVREWFRKLDRHPHVDEIRPFVAEECTVNTPAMKDEPFQDWYGGTARYRDQPHAIISSNILVSPYTTTAKTIVCWSRLDSKSLDTERPLASYSVQTLTLKRSPQSQWLDIVVCNIEYLLDEVYLPLEVLLKNNLCSKKGERLREEKRKKKIVYDTDDNPIPDEKWLTLTQKILGLHDLKELSDKLVVSHDNWRDFYKRNSISDLVSDYMNPRFSDLSLEPWLERERDNAKWDNAMALFSSIAYEEKEVVSSFLTAFGFQQNDVRIIDDKETDTQGFLFRFKSSEGKTIVIHTWRGSTSKIDWKTNIDVGLFEYLWRKLRRKLRLSDSPSNSILIHPGIRKALKASFKKNKILEFVGEEPDTYNFLTGHSLGGGLANASVDLLVGHGKKIARLTTFGAAKAISRQGVDKLSPNIMAGAVRWISHSDPVPYLPPWLDVIGALFYFDNTDGPEKITNMTPNFWARTKEWIISFFKNNPVRHHNMDCYLFKTRNLEELLTAILNREEDGYEYKYPQERKNRRSPW
jgi:hypothetical protein